MRRLLIFTALLMPALLVYGQGKVTVSGNVIERLSAPVIGAQVLLMYNKDTLRTVTDTTGKFSFGQVASSKFSIRVRSLGYIAYQKNYEFTENSNINLDPVILKEDAIMLKNVVIKPDHISIRYHGDTTEYDAPSYKTREEDRVDQLLKQLPGIVIDKDGNVISMGKTLTKIRVNGKDFFTGNVKEFIKKLPANLISKVQIINDYGDIANFTGDKSGESNKILNLITKDKINSGKFGGALAEAGTNKKLGIEGNANLWKAEKQIAGSVKLNTQDNGAGNDNSRQANASYNDKLSQTTKVASSYKYTGTSTNGKIISNVKTVVGSQILNNQNINENSNSILGNSLMGVLSNRSEKGFLNLRLSGNQENNENSEASQSVQTGASRQDLNNLTSTNSQNQDINLNATYVRKLKKAGRSISLHILASGNDASSAENIFDQITYYDALTNNVKKDSLLNRLLDQSNRGNKITSSIYFTNPVSSKSDSTNEKRFSMGYSFSASRGTNQLATFVQKEDYKLLVDSLSNVNKSLFIIHSFNLYYSVNNKKWQYGVGFAPRISILSGQYERINEGISRSSFNLVPTANIDFNGENKSFRLSLLQTTTEPSLDQLQPVSDLRNLQRIVIGNPDLKAQSKHTLSMDYRSSSKKYKVDYAVQFMGNMTQNNVVTNTLLRTDTLNTLQQEVHYVNANGNFEVGFNFFVSKSFDNNTYLISLINNITYANNVFFSNNVRGSNNITNISPSLILQMNKNPIFLNTGVAYHLTTNNYTLDSGNESNIEGWSFDTSGNIALNKSLKLIYNIDKKINKGYVIGNSNPLLINLEIEKLLFKKKSSVKLSAFDLLNEGNNQQRTFFANTITDARSNQVTRYFSLSFILNVDKFFNAGF